MTTTIRSNADGSKSYIAVGGTDRVTIGSQGIETGSLAPESVTPTELSQKLTSGTAVVASGTAIDFTGIPSWVKRITLVLSEVSTNGTSMLQIQIGDSEGIETASYLCSSSYIQASVSTANYTTGAVIPFSDDARSVTGSLVLTKVSGNKWEFDSKFRRGDAAATAIVVGEKTTSLALDRLRLTTVNGTDTFDAGLINIMWE